MINISIQGLVFVEMSFTMSAYFTPFNDVFFMVATIVIIGTGTINYLKFDYP